MPLIPNFLERLFLLGANQGPGPSLDLFGAVGLRVAMAANRADVLHRLSARPETADDLATALELDVRSTRTLLALLEALGYVRERGGRFRLTRMSRKWMTADADVPHVDFLRWWDEVVFPFWDEQIDRVLRVGEPSIGIYEWLDSQPNGWEVAQRGFEAVARQLAPVVAKRVDLSDAGRILDLGGGHGLYAVEMCRKNHQLRAVIFDKPEALQRATSNIQGAGLEQRLTTVGGDLLTDDLGTGYDAALLFNLVHGFSPEENQGLLVRVRQSLSPGGRIFILDQFAGRLPGRVGPFTLRFLDFAYLVAFQGQVYDIADLTRWLEVAGFGDVDLTRFVKAPGMSLLSADAT